MDSSYPCGSSPTCQPKTLNLQKGIYFFEAWGAAGTDNQCNSDYEPHEIKGRGAYTSGILKLKNPKTFYVYSVMICWEKI